jgi:hypothetical protein
VWGYDQTLKIAYQATALSLYSLTFQPDHRHLLDVKHPRRIETHFRRPQLDLWQLSDTAWLLALRRPAQGKRSKRRKPIALARQLPFPQFSATGELPSGMLDQDGLEDNDLPEAESIDLVGIAPRSLQACL